MVNILLRAGLSSEQLTSKELSEHNPFVSWELLCSPGKTLCHVDNYLGHLVLSSQVFKMIV